MQESQIELAIGIGDPTIERLARPILNLGVHHLAFHLRLHAETQVADRDDARFVDITQWQMQQQTLNVVNTESLQAG